MPALLSIYGKSNESIRGEIVQTLLAVGVNEQTAEPVVTQLPKMYLHEKSLALDELSKAPTAVQRTQDALAALWEKGMEPKLTVLRILSTVNQPSERVLNALRQAAKDPDRIIAYIAQGALDRLEKKK